MSVHQCAVNNLECADYASGKKMKLGIMQPYFLPYIGYFQLIAAVDTFVIYDNIKYTKKGWINRNRILVNGADVLFTLPLKSGSDSLDVVHRDLAVGFDRVKLINQFKNAYSHAPYFTKIFPLLERIVLHEDENLFRYIYHSTQLICEYLGIKTNILVSSKVSIDHNLKGQNKVLALCKAIGAYTYINTIGGLDLYSHDDFQAQGIDLEFIKPQLVEYKQFDSAFVPWLSIVDVMMFNSPSRIFSEQLFSYELIKNL